MRIEPTTFEFLENLRTHNDRTWFQENKQSYQYAMENFKKIVQHCLDGLSAQDPFLPNDLGINSTLFRIYRDARFSHDKTPYKTWFGAAMGPEGRKTPGPVYYMHLEPSKSFLALGYWRPEKTDLTTLREEIDYNLEEFEGILEEVRHAGWTGLDLEDRLKKAPKPYSSDNPAIEHLKNKSFTISFPVPDEICFQKDFSEWAIEKYLLAKPFKNFIHGALGGKTDFTHSYQGEIL